MRTLRVLLVVLVICLVLAVAALAILDQVARHDAQDLTALPRRTVTVHDRPLTLLVADTPATVGPGLSGQAGLGDDEGLLLVSPDGDTRVTMLGMRFALDIVWLDAAQRVVAVLEGVPARPWPLARNAPSTASAVLELPAGGVSQYGIRTGDVIGR